MSVSKKKPSHILITGASSGLGEALALYYAAPGVRLALSGRNKSRLEEVARQCEGKGAAVASAVLDATDRSAMEKWIQDTDAFMPLDLVIANAGISGGTGNEGEPFDQAREIFRVNLDGVLNTLSPVLPLMVQRHSGQVAIISSLAGFRGFPGAPAYSASKGAVRFYGEALRGALWHTGVKVNVVCPGFVRTRMTDSNGFKMPFLMDVDKAAALIANGLSKDKSRIAFPWPLHFGVWFLSILPDRICQEIVKRLPAKGRRTNTG
jgi:short-subunit dehydrogenase